MEKDNERELHGDVYSSEPILKMEQERQLRIADRIRRMKAYISMKYPATDKEIVTLPALDSKNENSGVSTESNSIFGSSAIAIKQEIDSQPKTSDLNAVVQETVANDSQKSHMTVTNNTNNVTTSLTNPAEQAQEPSVSSKVVTPKTPEEISLRQQLEERFKSLNLDEKEKQRRREIFSKVEADAAHDQKRLTTDDFEPLVLIGKGAFGEVRLVRMRGRYSREVYG